MTRIGLKPLHRQAIVLTGATPSIDLATARLAADCGARLLLIARNEDALREIRAGGGTAEYAVADIADRARLQSAAVKARRWRSPTGSRRA